MAPEMAKLTPLTENNQPDTSKALPVQFNPQSLSVVYNTTGPGGNQGSPAQSGTQRNPLQPTSYTASLTVDLLFDTSQTGSDVRKTTLQIAAMMMLGAAPTDTKKSRPVMQFQWGSFIFNGAITAMTETLDFFSEQGVPLRASIHLSITGVETEPTNPSSGFGSGTDLAAGFGAGFSAGISASVGFSASAGAGFSAGASVNAGIAVGTTPLTLSQAGDTLQSLTARSGVNSSWKAIASANNIDNPRLVQPGTVLNLNVNANAEANGKVNL